MALQYEPVENPCFRIIQNLKEEKGFLSKTRVRAIYIDLQQLLTSAYNTSKAVRLHRCSGSCIDVKSELLLICSQVISAQYTNLRHYSVDGT